ncbi:serine hydrolase domain-containing protein [Sphingosinicella rhizophila]|uniref:Serine hydrolase domain-containing protein n=1 Tax=Sphingosinicella rhizophila TaxID=3050082 RepID=A0ABU3Q9N0_9SPHN|nr:serine hydrolase domain-containing protein [Sphingosinicella sp. GR2756]MDT9600099.1 serine hydrolase domain-containing protein [Sphingosinicella sp. GR2756]
MANKVGIMLARCALLMLLASGSHLAAGQAPSPLAARFPIEEQRRFELQRRAPESEAVLRDFIRQIQAGTPDYDRMAPRYAAWIRADAPVVERAKAVGTIQSISFRAVAPAALGENYLRQACPQGCPDPKPVSAADVYHVTGSGGTSAWYVALAPDGRIEFILARAMEVPPAAPLPLDAAIASVRATLEKQVAADQFSGALIVSRNGREIFAFAGGIADREKRIPVAADTRFRLGSMNKMFTAVAIMQLVEAGKVDLDAPFGRYLADYPNQDLARSVTVHHLLTHTGGTGDIFGPQFEARRLTLRTHQDYVDLYGTRAADGQPGAAMSYSNYGFILLGRIIERVSGLSYYDYVDRHIFKPAGMTWSGSVPEDQAVAGRAVAYSRITGALASAADSLPYRGTSAGGGYSTAGDMIRFGQALLSNELLSPLAFRYLTGGKVRMGEGFYGYGFFDFEDATGHWTGHGGGAPGMNGDLRIYPETGTVIVALSNLDPPAAQNAMTAAANQIVPAMKGGAAN